MELNAQNSTQIINLILVCIIAFVHYKNLSFNKSTKQSEKTKTEKEENNLIKLIKRNLKNNIEIVKKSNYHEIKKDYEKNSEKQLKDITYLTYRNLTIIDDETLSKLNNILKQKSFDDMFELLEIMKEFNSFRESLKETQKPKYIPLYLDLINKILQKQNIEIN